MNLYETEYLFCKCQDCQDENPTETVFGYVLAKSYAEAIEKIPEFVKIRGILSIKKLNGFIWGLEDQK